MKRFSQQLKKQANQTRLSVADKRALKERLTAYMEYHPLPKERSQMAHTATQLVSEPFTMVRFNFAKWRGGAALLSALVLMIIPVVAERSIPGDVLYPVKVQFNEEVRSKLSLSPYQRVEWETTRIERRIAEARLLADAGKLTEEAGDRAAKAVKAHSDAAQKEIDEIATLDSDDAALAGITFSAALEVQSEVLARDTETGSQVEGLVFAVAAAQADAEENQSVEKPSYKKLLARLEIETTRAQEYLASIATNLTDANQADIDRRLEDIKRNVAVAIELHASSSATSTASTTLAVASGDPIALLTQSLADTRKLISFMTDLEVKESVEIEDLVPVVLTLEERVKLVREELGTISANTKKVTNLRKQITDPAMAEKVDFGLTVAAEAAQNASSTLATSTVAVAESSAKKALTILTDLATMITAVNTLNATETEEPILATTTPKSEETVEVATTTESVEEPEEGEEVESEVLESATTTESIETDEDTDETEA